MGVLEELRDEKYRIGSLQALPYDRRDPLFGPTYLSDLYVGLTTGRRSGIRPANLQMLFCGMSDLTHDSIVSYLAIQKQLWVLGKWEGDILRTGGICWLSAKMGTKEKAGFGAYGFLRWTWGTEDQEMLGWLGLSALFGDDLIAIHGQRYECNHLTARFMVRFGFRDLATIPKMIDKNGILENCVLSMVSRDTFENLLSQKIVTATLALS